MSRYRNIVILTGAGISAESGVQTFRGAGGLWEGERVEDVATPQAFVADPLRVQRFYNERRAGLKTIEPNAAHKALAKLEVEHIAEVLVVTQNVDDLHERGGSKNLIHMHGELRKARCLSCESIHIWEDDIAIGDTCPACGEADVLRPHIVWFGEMPFAMNKIDAALARCDLFISIGTSGNVYPAAGFVETINYYGRAHSVELNLEPSLGSRNFAETRHGPATKIVTQYVDELLVKA